MLIVSLVIVEEDNVKKVEIYIVAGFLGSGKTTLLAQLLTSCKNNNLRPGVILNELGTVAVDSQIIDDTTPLKELLDGCICCTLQGKFELQLEEMISHESLDVIFIETTGVAHPFEVFEVCLSPLYADRVHLRGVITVVDLFRYRQLDTLPEDMQELILEQIRFADFLLLNKIDLLTEDEVGKFLFQIQAFNPHAKFLLTEYAKININEINHLMPIAKTTNPALHISKHLDFQTFVYRFTKKVSYDQFLNFFWQLPKTIIRIKGFVRFNHSSTLYSFQYAWGVPILLPYEDETNELIVIIGYDLDEEQMINNLQYL